MEIKEPRKESLGLCVRGRSCSSLATITYIDEGEFLRMNMISSVVVEDKNKMAKNQELAHHANFELVCPTKTPWRPRC